MASLFEADIASLKGVGPKRAELFRKLGAPTVGDLLRLYPRAYEDWRDAVPIRNTLLNEVNIVKRHSAAPSCRAAYPRRHDALQDDHHGTAKTTCS